MENKNITITNAVTTCEDKVIFLGKETTSEYFEYYVGKIKDGKLVDVKQLSDDVKKGISGNVKLFDNGTKLLTGISREYPADRGAWLFDLSEDGSEVENKTKLNFDFITGDSYTMPVIDIDYDKDIIYYMDNENNVCKASLSATIEKAKNNAKENCGQSNNEKTEYKDGDNSSDAYDKGNFTS